MRTFAIVATLALTDASAVKKTGATITTAALAAPVGHVSGSVTKSSPTDAYGSDSCPIKCISTQAGGASSHDQSSKSWIVQVFHTTNHAAGAHGPATQSTDCADNAGGCTASKVVPHTCKHDESTNTCKCTCAPSAPVQQGQCWLYATSCPDHPTVSWANGWGRDLWGEENKNAGNDANACAQRAKDQFKWCGTTGSNSVSTRHIVGNTVANLVAKTTVTACPVGETKVLGGDSSNSCRRNGCWRDISVCPNHPETVLGEAYDHYAMDTLSADATICAARAQEQFDWCGMSNGDMAKSSWHGTGDLTEILTTSTMCKRGEVPKDGVCVKTGCWISTDACPNQAPGNVHPLKKDLWGEANAGTGTDAAKCAERATGVYNWCGTTGTDVVRTVFYGDSGNTEGIVTEVGNTGPDMDDKGEQNCGTAHKSPCTTQWLPNDGCSKETALASPHNDNKCWPCGANDEFACKFQFADNQGCGPDDTLAKGGDESQPHANGPFHGYNDVNPNPHPAGKCWVCGGDNQPRCDNKYADNNGCMDGHSGTHHANKCWICTRSNVSC